MAHDYIGGGWPNRIDRSDWGKLVGLFALVPRSTETGLNGISGNIKGGISNPGHLGEGYLDDERTMLDPLAKLPRISFISPYQGSISPDPC